MYAAPSSIHIRKAIEPVESITAEEAMRRARAAHYRLHPRPAPVRMPRLTPAIEPGPVAEEVPMIEAAPIPEPAQETEAPKPVEFQPFSMSVTVSFTGFSASDDVAAPRVRAADIVTQTAEHYGLSRHDLISERRTQNLLRPRQVAMYLSKELTLLSLPQIGAKIGGRDHTTVLHGCRRIAQFLADGDGKLHADIAAIKKRLGVSTL